MENTLFCSVTQGINLPENSIRGGHMGGIINGQVLVVGGTNWNKEKNKKFFLDNSLVFKENIWVKGPSLPKALAYSMFAYNSLGLFLAGGTTDGVTMSNEVYMLNSTSENNNWKKLQNLPDSVGFGAATILNNKFYVAGGTTNEGYTKKMWVLDISDNNAKWIECPPIPGKARMLHSLVACGNYLYLLGGLAESSDLTPLANVYRFDPNANIWIELADLKTKGYGWVSQPIDDEKLIVTGRADGQVHKDVLIVNLNDMSINNVGSLVLQSTTAPLIQVSDSTWWLVGGEPDSERNRTGKVSVIKIK